MVAPVAATTRAWAASRAARVGSQVVIRAPYPATAAFFTAGALLGMTMWAATPRSWAARARAWAWLPEEWATTPRAASRSPRANTALQAPRNLNAPTRCRFSHLRNTWAPTCRSRLAQVHTGVRWA